MKKPDVQAKADELQRWIDDEVRPYLQALLNQAQSRLRAEIRFYDSCGVCYVDFGSRSQSSHSNWCTQNLWSEGQEGDAFFRRFPELLELRTIVYQIDDLLNRNIDDIVPTVRPWRKP